MIKQLFFWLLAFCLFQVPAQNGFVINDVSVFDGETYIPKTSVKIQDSLIVQVAPEIKANSNFRIIDGNGKFLMAALSNAHVHAWSPMQLKGAAKAGVLNVMDMHGIENYQQFMLNVKDSTDYARFFRAGFAATAPDGHGTQFGFSVPTLQKPEDAKDFVQQRKASNVDYLKIIVEPELPTLGKETVAALIDEAHKQNLKAVVHISLVSDAIEVIEQQADGLVHIWRNEPITDKDLKRLSTNEDFFVIPTLLTMYKAIDYVGDENNDIMSKTEVLNEVKRVYDAGIPILTGTDPPNFEINYGADLYEEMLLYEKAGIPNNDILKTATVNVAKAFNLENYGMVKEGFKADLILIEGNPTASISDIKNIAMVWKNGKLVKR